MREEYSGEGKFNVMITHYDLIMRDKAFLKKIHWYYMIVDEGHRLKNHECALARTLVSGYATFQFCVFFKAWIFDSILQLLFLFNLIYLFYFGCVNIKYSIL